MNHKAKWQLFAPLGLVLTGLGLSVTMDASNRKAQSEPWFWRGTLGLIIFNAGVSVFGDAIAERLRYEYEQEAS